MSELHLPQYHRVILNKLAEGHYIYINEDALFTGVKYEIRHKDTNSLIRTIHERTFNNIRKYLIFKNGRYYYEI